MSMQKSSSNPFLIINNVAVEYEAGTFSFTEGAAEKKVRTQTSGGNSVTRVSSIDVTTQFSTIKFQLLNTAFNIELAKTWLDNDFNNAISITDDGYTRFGSNAGITNKYEVGTGPDGKIDIQFQCDSLV